MKNCQRCGSANSDSASFCNICHEKFNVESKKEDNDKLFGQNKKAIIIKILLVSLVLVAVFILHKTINARNEKVIAYNVSQAEWSPRNIGEIAYIDNKAIDKLFVISMGRSKKRIAVGSVINGFDWHPNRKEIVFYEGGDLWIINVNNKKKRLLTKTTGSFHPLPRYNYNGSRISFIEDSSSNTESLVVINSDGTNRRVIENIFSSSYSWHPRVDNISFFNGKNDDIWIAAERNQKKILDIGLSSMKAGIAWNPGGDKIAFSSASSSGRENNIYIYMLKAKKLAKIASDSRPLGTSSNSWSPDSKKITYILRSKLAQNDMGVYIYEGDIWVMDADGNNKQQITSNRRDDRDPQFSPDGKHLLYISTDQGGSSTNNRELRVVDLE